MGRGRDFAYIPIIDVSDLVAGRPSQAGVAERLGEACRESGFFYVVGHGVDEDLLGHSTTSAGSSSRRTSRRTTVTLGP